MTLIFYFPCKDGCVLISDRMETNDTGAGTATNKIFLSRNREFAIGGVGDSKLIERLFAEIYSDNTVNGTNIVEKFEEKTQNLSADDLKYVSSTEDLEYRNAKFIIVVWQAEGARVTFVSVVKGKHFSVGMNRDYHQVEGEGDDWANYFLKNRAYQNFTLKEAIAYGIAIMQEVADNHRGVGRLEQFGFSIVAYSKDHIFYYTDYRTASPRITMDFQADEFDMTGFKVEELEQEAAQNG